MHVEIVQLEEISGRASKVYSVRIDTNSEHEFERFINGLTDNEWMSKLAERLYSLQQDCKRRGLREDFFKPEGGATDALVRIRNTGQIRVYGILYSKLCIILGGGGIKENVRTYQEVPELYNAVKLLKRIADEIQIRIKEREIRFEDDGTIVGDHSFTIE